MSFPVERYLTFFGPIVAPATNNFRAAICGMVNEGAQKVTILFSSGGGSVDDGVALYTYLNAQPIEVTMHAVGVVGSVAIPVFLAGKKRLASKNARFFFHGYTWTHSQPNIVTKATMSEHAILLDWGMEWSKETVVAHTRLGSKDFETLKLYDHPYLMATSEATKFGLISGVTEPSVPAGSQPRVSI